MSCPDILPEGALEMTGEAVSYLDAYQGIKTLFGFRCDLSSSDGLANCRALIRFNRGKLPFEEMPKQLWHRSENKKSNSRKKITSLQKGWRLFHRGRFLVSRCARKEGFELEHSKNMKMPLCEDDTFQAPERLTCNSGNSEFSVNCSVTKNADFWKGPRLNYPAFVCDRLFRALHEDNLLTPLRCLVLRG